MPGKDDFKHLLECVAKMGLPLPTGHNEWTCLENKMKLKVDKKLCDSVKSELVEKDLAGQKASWCSCGKGSMWSLKVGKEKYAMLLDSYECVKMPMKVDLEAVKKCVATKGLPLPLLEGKVMCLPNPLKVDVKKICGLV